MPVETFELDEIENYKYFYEYKFKRLSANNRLLRKILKPHNSFKIFNDNNFNIDKLKANNYFIGYWQSLKYLEKNQDYLIKSLSKNEEIKKGFNTKAKNGSTLVHVRRTDYERMGEELNLDYYSSSLKYCMENIEDFNFNIFTDDISWVENQKIFNDANSIHTSSDNPSEVISTFSLMLQNENFILANSTFSLLAAFFGKNDKSKILYPDPWFKSRKYNKHIADRNWININNNYE